MVQYAETDLDRRQRERVEQSKRERTAAASEGQGAAETAEAKDAGQKAVARKGDRWAAYNAFVDVIAPRLTLAEQAAWHVMFRHTRNGVCEISERALATAAAIDKVTAGRALRLLVRVGLAWLIYRSNSKAHMSKYGMHPRPADRLTAVITEKEQERK